MQVEEFLKIAQERRHLLEEAEFWSLEELADLAKGSGSDIGKYMDTAAPKAASLATAALLATRSNN